MIVNNKMSNDENSFILKAGMFATCSEIWDKATLKYRDANSTEVYQCCSKQCMRPVEWCYKYCKENTFPEQKFKLDKCMESCDYQKNLCLDTCKLSRVGMDNNYLQCIKQYGCTGVNNLPDKDCVIKHNDKIFDCCLQTCVPAKDLDCKQHCEHNHSIALNQENTGVTDKRTALSTIKSNFKRYPDNTLTYILGGLALGILIIIIWLFITQRKLK